MKKALTAAVVEGMFLSDVLGFIDRGDFVEINSSIVDGEEVIGDMTPFEKGLRAYVVSMCKKETEIIEHLEEMLKADQEPAEFRSKTNELNIIRDGHELADKLMWNSIHNRTKTWGEVIGIRAGYKIVKPSNGDHGECGYLICQLKKYFGGITGVMRQ